MRVRLVSEVLNEAGMIPFGALLPASSLGTDLRPRACLEVLQRLCVRSVMGPSPVLEQVKGSRFLLSLMMLPVTERTVEEGPHLVLLPKFLVWDTMDPYPELGALGGACRPMLPVRFSKYPGVVLNDFELHSVFFEPKLQENFEHRRLLLGTTWRVRHLLRIVL